LRVTFDALRIFFKFFYLHIRNQHPRNYMTSILNRSVSIAFNEEYKSFWKIFLIAARFFLLCVVLMTLYWCMELKHDLWYDGLIFYKRVARFVKIAYVLGKKLFLKNIKSCLDLNFKQSAGIGVRNRIAQRTMQREKIASFSLKRENTKTVSFKE